VENDTGSWRLFGGTTSKFNFLKSYLSLNL